MERLSFPAKMIRAKMISEYVRSADYSGVVVFTCGNAAAALRAEGLDVLEIGESGTLAPRQWWTPAEIHRIWPTRFDATSGHLPMPMMAKLTQAFRYHLGELPNGEYLVPTGSGETILCLRWAYPAIRFEPAYNVGRGTEYNEFAPLNTLVSSESAE
jgi:hypothetical protein